MRDLEFFISEELAKIQQIYGFLHLNSHLQQFFNRYNILLKDLMQFYYLLLNEKKNY